MVGFGHVVGDVRSITVFLFNTTTGHLTPEIEIHKLKRVSVELPCNMDGIAWYCNF